MQDDDGSGELDIEELRAVFLSTGMYVSPYELEDIFTKVDKDGGGTVSIDEFMAWLRGSSPEAAKLRRQMLNGGGGSGGDADDVDDGSDDPVFSAKMKLRRLATMNGNLDFGKLFAYYDRDGGGEIDFNEFKSAIRRDALISPRMLPQADLLLMFAHIGEALHKFCRVYLLIATDITCLQMSVAMGR